MSKLNLATVGIAMIAVSISCKSFMPAKAKTSNEPAIDFTTPGKDLDVKVELDRKQTAKGKVGKTGGSVSLKAADGSTFTLNIPPKALETETEITVTGDAGKAEFVDPASAIITNKKGEILFTDIRIHRVIKIAGGKVSTLAGNNIIDPCSQNIAGRAQEGNRDGKALTALFNFPKGMAYDSKGNLFIADTSNHSIRKIITRWSGNHFCEVAFD